MVDPTDQTNSPIFKKTHECAIKVGEFDLRQHLKVTWLINLNIFTNYHFTKLKTSVIPTTATMTAGMRNVVRL